MSSAFWYGGVAWSNDALSNERDDSRLLMPAGMFFVVIAGWLLLRWTYCRRTVRLCEGLVGAVVKVKGNVYEVNDLFIGFNCDM